MLALVWMMLAALALPFRSKGRQQVIVLRRQVHGRAKLTSLDRAITDDRFWPDDHERGPTLLLVSVGLAGAG